MPTVTKYPSAVQAAGGSFNGSWTGAVSTVQSDNAVYATAAPGKNQEYASVFQVPFSTGEVPAGATINSALVELQVKCSTTSSVGVVTSSLFADSAQATAIGAVPGVQTPATEPTVDTTYNFTRNPTEPQVRDLWVRVQGTRGNSNTALTWSLDFVRVTVDYTAPPAAISGSGGVSFGYSLSGTGTAQGPSYTGTGGVTFGFSEGGGGTYLPPAIAGSGGVTFPHSSAGTGNYTPPAVTGTGDVAFGFSLEGAGTTGAPTFTGSGGVAFGFVVGGEGTAALPGIVGDGGVSFGFSLDASGSYTAPSIEGSGGVAFGFSASGSGAFVAPAITGTGSVSFGFSVSGTSSTVTYPYRCPHGHIHHGPNGPWEAHGVMHYGHQPLNH